MPYSYKTKSDRDRTDEIFNRVVTKRYVQPKLDLPKETICFGAKNRHYYFAYGANLNKNGMNARCPGWKGLCIGELKDHRLVFRGVADVIPSKGHSVQGMIYELTDAHFKALDRFEGFPNFYDRKVVQVQGFNCIVYFMVSGGSYDPPQASYKQTITDGLQDWRLPVKSHFKDAICGERKKTSTKIDVFGGTVPGSEMYGVYNHMGFTIYDEVNEELKNKDMVGKSVKKIKKACERHGTWMAKRTNAKWCGVFPVQGT